MINLLSAPGDGLGPGGWTDRLRRPAVVDPTWDPRLLERQHYPGSRWPIRSERERFWEKVDATGDCWLWTGHLNSGGYGQFRTGRPGERRRTVLAHRWAWAALIGPIPEGFEPDHQCRQRPCVYVGGHIVLETITKNRGYRHAVRTHCFKGHPLTGKNLQLRMSGGRLTRRCATCHREQEHDRHRRRREAGLE